MNFEIFGDFGVFDEFLRITPPLKYHLGPYGPYGVFWTYRRSIGVYIPTFVDLALSIW